jgi:hypothetical protein
MNTLVLKTRTFIDKFYKGLWDPNKY